MLRDPWDRKKFKWSLDELLDGNFHVVDLVADGWPKGPSSFRPTLYEEARARGLGVHTGTDRNLPTRVKVQAFNPHPVGSVDYWWAELRLQVLCTCRQVDDRHQVNCDKVTSPKSAVDLLDSLNQALGDKLGELLIFHKAPEVIIDKPARAGSLEEFQQRLRDSA